MSDTLESSSARPTDDELARCLATLEALHALPRRELVTLAHTAQILAAGYSLARRCGRDARDPAWRRKGAPEEPPSVEEEPRERRRRAFHSPDAALAMTSGELALQEREAPDAPTHRALRCYMCDAPFRGDPSDPSRRCASCALLESAKRARRPDLSERVAIVTGGRVRIGYAVCLSLLRAGATVHATSRFGASALDRFAREHDYPEFASRLAIHSLDLCDLPATERFAERFVARFGAPDILVNNAARTIDHPPAWLDTMRAIDQQRLEALPEGARESILSFDAAPTSRQLGEGALSLALDPEGQPHDARARNAWRAKIGEVPLRELLAVHAVNALAPFILIDRFRDAMTRGQSRATPRFVVNVTSPEGRFYRRYKGPWHPHTNMAKAALDMLTRTCAEELANHSVYVTSVDPGWVSDQHTTALRESLVHGGDFEAPVSALDAAARVLDPIYSALEGAPPAWGVVFRNYAPCPW